ncbi:MAG TPA: dTDP-4-dehydrorhamnose reductase [Acidimicrobiia bacterium]|nr:dTDP-4-dehydrorhamnose reductase [Acidimicrobiia bacterium]
MRLLGDDAVPLTRADLDLASPDHIAPTLDGLDPSMVVNCAAYTAVDRAEEEEDLATAVNSVAVGVLAEWAAVRSRPMLTFSTDYVFDGFSDEPYVETSPTNPVNAYGRSKLPGETLAAGQGALVVRTSWVISGSHPNFVATILHKVKEQELRVVDDQRGNPTVAADLARASFDALGAGVTGLLHLTNEGETTWYELARTSVGLADLDPSRISPCATEDYPTPARRPAYSVLASERLEDLGLEPLPHWRTSIWHVVDELKTWI